MQQAENVKAAVEAEDAARKAAQPPAQSEQQQSDQTPTDQVRLSMNSPAAFPVCTCILYRYNRASWYCVKHDSRVQLRQKMQPGEQHRPQT